ncbi:galactose-3-O-sulfotransferase 3 isoform X1 [Hydra vulgaris]|nr:galactose-3-O-sulfotransferase 3 isoform X1 [Hydra vulgaris]XP_047143593.1 galactose-3-O-sulfotransferase 3 isoform X1 [Hydra vulgaris]
MDKNFRNLFRQIFGFLTMPLLRLTSLKISRRIAMLLLVLFIWEIHQIVYYEVNGGIAFKRNITSKEQIKKDIGLLVSNANATASTPTTEISTTINSTSPVVTVSTVTMAKKYIYQNVIFLKTHKTGSSTVTNVLQRYAKLNNLNVALPQCDHRFCYPKKFDESYIYKHKTRDTYNMLFNHAVFDKEKMLNIMAPNTKIVTIIREPYAQFDSAAQYLNFKLYFNLTGRLPLLDEFFELSEDFLKRLIQSTDPAESESAFALAKNPNAFDLGFDVWEETPEYIESVLKSISRDFDLVMITEYMEESLVLLKNELNWNLEDVVFFSHNARQFKEKNTNDIENVTRKILNWNKIDAAIYKHFNQTFWTKIANSPPDFYTDVNKLKEWNRDLVNQCTGKKTTESSTYLTKSYFEKTRGSLCYDIIREEIPFTIWFKWTLRYKKRGFFPINFY